jgi:hypothetical protein
MQYTKLDTTILKKPKYYVLIVTAISAQLQFDGVCAFLPKMIVEMRMAASGMINAMRRYSGCEMPPFLLLRTFVIQSDR